MTVTEEIVDRALDAADYIPNADNRKWMRAALTAALEGQPDRFRHLKRGSTYRAAFWDGEVQTSRPIVEGDRLVTYVGKDGKVWHRLVEEFTDGRFERIGGA